MPIHNKGDFGDLLISLKIKFPQDLTEEQRTKLQKFFEGRDYWWDKQSINIWKINKFIL